MANWYKWTEKMDLYLLLNFQWVGDKRLAEMFQEKFPKHYPWTKKHIEKRRGYLGLKRTDEQVSHIRRINNGDGRHYKAWDTRGRMQEGEVRTWEGRKYIKVKGKVHLYYRYITNARKGQIVRTHEGGIRIIDQRENQLLNAKLRAARPPEFKRTVKALNQLNKLLHAKENRGSTRNAV